MSLRQVFRLFCLIFLLFYSNSIHSQSSVVDIRTLSDSLDRQILWKYDYSIESRDALLKRMASLGNKDSLQWRVLETYVLWSDVHGRPGSSDIDKRIVQSWKSYQTKNDSSSLFWKQRINYLSLKLPLIRGQYSQLLIELKEYVERRKISSDTSLLVDVFLDIGQAAVQLEQPEMGLEYLERANKLSQIQHNCSREIQALATIAGAHFLLGNLEKASLFFQTARDQLEFCDYKSDLLTANVLVRNANFLSQQKSFDEAEELYLKASSVLNLEEQAELFGFINAFRARNFLEEGNWTKAERLAEEGLIRAKSSKRQRLELLCLKLFYRIDLLRNNYRDAIVRLQYIDDLEDRLDDQGASDALTRLEMQLRFQQKELADSLRFENETLALKLSQEKELQSEKRRRNWLWFIGLGLSIIAINMWFRLRESRIAQKKIEKEKRRSEELLLNILPKEIAEELKSKGKSEARSHQNVSVLFADFNSFTSISKQISPEELVEEIDHSFSAFDQIMGKYGIEKIKTIGDAYMAAAGLSGNYKDSAIQLIRASLEMQSFMQSRYQERSKKKLLAFEMRVGIHTGDLVAGVVGKKKFQYDLWGDSVNMASRMETNSQIGQVNISEETYKIVKDSSEFKFTHRGLIDVKGGLPKQMYFVHKSV